MSLIFKINSRLRFPDREKFGKTIPKHKIYQAGKASSNLKGIFVEHVDRIVLSSILTTQTLNLPPRNFVEEIRIISIVQKIEKLPVKIIETIDKVIAYPTLFICCYQDKIQYAASFKRPSESEKGKWVTGAYFFSPWFPADSTLQDLPLALDLKALYDQLIAGLVGIEKRPEEDVFSLTQRAESLRIKQDLADRLQNKVDSEKQYNRRIELNRELKQLKIEIEGLK